MARSTRRALVCGVHRFSHRSRRPAAAQALTLASAIEQTLARNPELRVYRAAAPSRARARARAAALRPPLELRDGSPGRVRHGPSQRLRHRRRRRLRCRRSSSSATSASCARAPLDASAALIDAERAAAELDVLAEVTRRFIHVAADQEHLALTMRATVLAEDNVAAAAARVAAARAPDVELRRARITSARVAVAQEHAEHELLTSRRKLAAMWGDSERDVRARQRRPLRVAAERRLRSPRRASREQSGLRAVRIRGTAARRRAARRGSARAHGPHRAGRRAAPRTTPTTRRSCSA